MTTISVTEARAKLPELVEDVANHLTEYAITKHGRTYAVLVSAREYEALLETLEVLSDSKAIKRIRRGVREIADGDAVSFAEAVGDTPA